MSVLDAETTARLLNMFTSIPHNSSNPDILDEALFSLLQNNYLAGKCLTPGDSRARADVSRRWWKTFIACGKRQLAHDKQGNSGWTWQILGTVGWLLFFAVIFAPAEISHSQRLAEILEDGGMVVCAKSLPIIAPHVQRDSRAALHFDGWTNFLKLINTTLENKDPVVCTPEFSKIVYSVYRPYYNKIAVALGVLQFNAVRDGASMNDPRVLGLMDIQRWWNGVAVELGIHENRKPRGNAIWKYGCNARDCPNQPIELMGIHKTAGKTKSCASCKQARYCSRECQKRDWPSHKRQCKQITENPPSNYAEDEIEEID